MRREQHWFTGQGNIVEHMQSLASPSSYVCPDCKGALWEITGSRPARYRCHTGHAFTLSTLYETQFAQSDEALWSALRALQEQELLLYRLADENAAVGDTAAAGERRLQRDRVHERSEVLRRFTTP